MTDTATKLYEGQPSGSDTLLYTDAGTGTIVRGIHVANTTAIAATITLGLNAAGALAAANHFLSAVTIPPNGTYDWSGFQMVSANGTIRALQGTASALTVTISGVVQ